MNKNNTVITKISKGQRLTAAKLNEFSKGLNSLSRGYDNPRSTQRLFAEVSRTVTVATITPTATIAGSSIMTDYPLAVITVAPVEIDQIDSITFKDGTGETITLQFFNPPVV